LGGKDIDKGLLAGLAVDPLAALTGRFSRGRSVGVDLGKQGADLDRLPFTDVDLRR